MATEIRNPCRSFTAKLKLNNTARQYCCTLKKALYPIPGKCYDIPPGTSTRLSFTVSFQKLYLLFLLIIIHNRLPHCRLCNIPPSLPLKHEVSSRYLSFQWSPLQWLPFPNKSFLHIPFEERPYFLRPASSFGFLFLLFPDGT